MASCPSRYTDALILGSFRTRLISDSTEEMLSPGNKRRFTIASAVGGTTFSFGGFENIEELRNRIICKDIHLIFGNHDHHIVNNRENCQRHFTTSQWFLQLNYLGETLECMHYPISSWNGLNKGRIHLHGHCHLPHHKKFGNGRRMDVGMDGNPEFAPYDLRMVINDMKNRPIGSELGVDDHHTDELKNVVG